jgi:hypothetical protein
MVDGEKCYSHRVYWERENGPIPEGLQIDHLCRNPGCVNPAHLELVTNAENTQRGLIAKLNPQKVRELRARISGGESMANVASALGVSERHARNVYSGLHWKEVR